MHLFPEEIDRLKGSLERDFDLPAPHAPHDNATEVTPSRKEDPYLAFAARRRDSNAGPSD